MLWQASKGLMACIMSVRSRCGKVHGEIMGWQAFNYGSWAFKVRGRRDVLLERTCLGTTRCKAKIIRC